MGCDIHVATEQLITIKDVQAWRNVDHYKLNHYYTPGDEDYGPEMEIVEVYKGRDYDLFAALADVRNYGHITPLADPRGVPADAHPRTKEYAEKYGADGHSHSYCTLQELYDYREKFPDKKQSGLITVAQARELDEDGVAPNSWCQATNMTGYVKREWTRKESPVDQLISVLQRRFNYWGDDKKIEKKQAEMIRIVFFFDN